MKRIVPLILILALLIATVAAETNEKATDFEQWNIELPVTATDTVTNTDVMPPQDESMAVADTAQKTDIVCVLKITTANIYTIQSLNPQFGAARVIIPAVPAQAFPIRKEYCLKTLQSSTTNIMPVLLIPAVLSRKINIYWNTDFQLHTHMILL